MKKVFLLFLGGLTLLAFISCQRKSAMESFRAENVKQIRTEHLTNGIPVILKNDPTAVSTSIDILFRGHAQLMSAKSQGIESLTLSLLSRGSKSYSREQLEQLFYKTSSSFNVSDGSPDYLQYSYQSLSKYFNTLMPVFLETLTQPRFDSQEFSRLKSEYLQDAQATSQDVSTQFVLQAKHAAFKGHPYALELNGTVASLSPMTLKDVENEYNSHFVPSRLIIAVAGKIDDEKALMAQLNSVLDTWQAKAAPLSIKPITPPESLKAAITAKSFPHSENLAYMAGVYLAPQAGSQDATGFGLMNFILRDLLMQVIRTEHSAAYTPYAAYRPGDTGYELLVAFKTQVPEKIYPLMSESVNMLVSGKTAAIQTTTTENKEVSPSAEKSFVPLSESLTYYKQAYLNSFYSAQIAEERIASQLALSMLVHNDPMAYLDIEKRVNAVTSQDIQSLAKKYLSAAPGYWLALGDSKLVGKVK